MAWDDFSLGSGMNNVMGYGALGLGAAGDIANALSANQQARQRNDIRNRYLGVVQNETTPAAVNAGAQQYYNAGKGALEASLPAIIRQQIAPQMGMNGITPDSAQGQFITQQAIAPLYAQLQQRSVDQYMNALQQKLAGLQGGLQSTANIYGKGGGTGDALKSLMALQQQQQYQNQMLALRRDALNKNRIGGDYDAYGNPRPMMVNTPGATNNFADNSWMAPVDSMYPGSSPTYGTIPPAVPAWEDTSSSGGGFG